jgi:hypothetical protein
MKVIDIYDFAENGKERYCGTKFITGKDEYLGKSHTYSYFHSRTLLKEAGMVMGLEKELEKNVIDRINKRLSESLF